ncbi:amino acid ABC transporter ATP-binding protein [uncultured Clostridium sp.]|uniref:amino acid ABC transporter ATP-binding protein n=1 Tax=uncultured Clostridium sp. TaxID=59620 RepID=UPI0025F623FE|nr:amino acid ABC transporter ATP-binding protein [uncultured Clostridium sp.]
MLKVSGLRKKYDNIEVLKGVDLEINNSETIVIVGPSGGGKTTLLRCINALEKPESGIIKIDDKVLSDGKNYANKALLKEIRKDIGLVFQSFNLFPHMTILENITEAPQRVLGQDKEVAINKGKEILEFLGLEDKCNNYPFELSGGQKQRVAIGRALALEPKLMCFDEPTSALDPGLTDEVSKLIRSFTSKGMSNLIITHDMNFAKSLADRIFSMNKGVLEEGLIFEEELN